MNINLLLDYQEADRELIKLNADLNKSAEAKAFAASRQQVNDAKDALLKLDKMAGDLIAGFDVNPAICAKNQEKAKEFRKVIKEVKELTEIDYVQKKLDELVNECAGLTRELNLVKEKIQQIKAKTNEAMKQGRDSQERYRDTKAAYDKKKDDMNPAAQAVLVKLSALEKQINDPVLVEKYKRLRSNNIMPIFVKCENATCMGCGMNIAKDIQTRLKDSGEVSECPNCGRLMYL